MEKMSILELKDKFFKLDEVLRDALVDDASFWNDYIDVHETVYNYRNPEHRFLVNQLGRISDNLIEAHKKLEYLKKQAKTPQSLHKNERGRYETENREYRPFESIRDGYPKYLLTRNDLIQKRNGVKHINIPGLMKEGEMFV